MQKDKVVNLKKLWLIVGITGMAILGLFACSNTVKASTEENNLMLISALDWNGDYDGIYDYVDPDTGVHYLVLSKKRGNGGIGGITPRLNSDLSVMVEPHN